MIAEPGTGELAVFPWGLPGGIEREFVDQFDAIVGEAVRRVAAGSHALADQIAIGVDFAVVIAVPAQAVLPRRKLHLGDQIADAEPWAFSITTVTSCGLASSIQIGKSAGVVSPAATGRGKKSPKMGYRNEAGVEAAAVAPFFGAIQDDGPQVDLGQGIRGDQVEIVTDVLAGMI